MWDPFQHLRREEETAGLIAFALTPITVILSGPEPPAEGYGKQPMAAAPGQLIQITFLLSELPTLPLTRRIPILFTWRLGMVTVLLLERVTSAPAPIVSAL